MSGNFCNRGRSSKGFESPNGLTNGEYNDQPTNAFGVVKSPNPDKDNIMMDLGRSVNIVTSLVTWG